MDGWGGREGKREGKGIKLCYVHALASHKERKHYALHTHTNKIKISKKNVHETKRKKISIKIINQIRNNLNYR